MPKSDLVLLDIDETVLKIWGGELSLNNKLIKYLREQEQLNDQPSTFAIVTVGSGDSIKRLMSHLLTKEYRSEDEQYLLDLVKGAYLFKSVQKNPTDIRKGLVGVNEVTSSRLFQPRELSAGEKLSSLEQEYLAQGIHQETAGKKLMDLVRENPGEIRYFGNDEFDEFCATQITDLLTEDQRQETKITLVDAAIGLKDCNFLKRNKDDREFYLEYAKPPIDIDKVIKPSVKLQELVDELKIVKDNAFNTWADEKRGSNPTPQSASTSASTSARQSTEPSATRKPSGQTWFPYGVEAALEKLKAVSSSRGKGGSSHGG